MVTSFWSTPPVTVTFLKVYKDSRTYSHVMSSVPNLPASGRRKFEVGRDVGILNPQVGSFPMKTPLKTNMSPKIQWLVQMYSLLQ